MSPYDVPMRILFWFKTRISFIRKSSVWSSPNSETAFEMSRNDESLLRVSVLNIVGYATAGSAYTVPAVSCPYSLSLPTSYDWNPSLYPNFVVWSYIYMPSAPKSTNLPVVGSWIHRNPPDWVDSNSSAEVANRCDMSTYIRYSPEVVASNMSLFSVTVPYWSLSRKPMSFMRHPSGRTPTEKNCSEVSASVWEYDVIYTRTLFCRSTPQTLPSATRVFRLYISRSEYRWALMVPPNGVIPKIPCPPMYMVPSDYAAAILEMSSGDSVSTTAESVSHCSVTRSFTSNA